MFDNKLSTGLWIKLPGATRIGPWPGRSVYPVPGLSGVLRKAVILARLAGRSVRFDVFFARAPEGALRKFCSWAVAPKLRPHLNAPRNHDRTRALAPGSSSCPSPRWGRTSRPSLGHRLRASESRSPRAHRADRSRLGRPGPDAAGRRRSPPASSMPSYVAVTCLRPWWRAPSLWTPEKIRPR